VEEAMRRVLLVAVVAAALVAGLVVVERASAHRARCHQAHTCPSDHATYRWRGWLCVAPYSDKRNATFKRRIVYGGRTCWCKR
jgi:hypothetical protein